MSYTRTSPIILSKKRTKKGTKDKEFSFPAFFNQPDSKKSKSFNRLGAVEGVVVRDVEEKVQLHFQKVDGGWILEPEESEKYIIEPDTRSITSLNTDTEAELKTEVNTQLNTSGCPIDTLDTSEGAAGNSAIGIGVGKSSEHDILRVADKCWSVMEEVGLKCLDVVLGKLGLGTVKELLSKYCDPFPLLTESNSVLDVFFYHNKGKIKCNLNPHFDPGFVTVVKDDFVEGFQARDEATGEMVALPIGKNEVLVILNKALAEISGDKVTATIHQVMSVDRPRTSIVYELRPNPDLFYPEPEEELVSTWKRTVF